MRRFLFFAVRCTVPALLAVLLWAVVFWPLPARLSTGIPFTAHHAGEQVVQSLVPGDHLQLLYHFWLTRDMLVGGTPWFHNLYEFNTGDDAARRVVDPGYVPFSLVYAALSPRLGHAAGWNVAQLLALLLALCLLTALARRYVRRLAPALAAAAFAMCLPYPWITLAIGSPTGFGMALVPAIALGLDLAVREGRRRGGVLAGGALLLCYTSDLHCFFGTLLVPAWCIVAWTAQEGWRLPARRDLGTLARALWPVAAAGLLAAGIAARLQAQYATTDVAGGRTLMEVAANSPGRLAMLGRVTHGADLHFRVGAALLLAVALTAVFVLVRLLATRRATVRADVLFRRTSAAALLLIVGVLGILALGLGMNGPFDGMSFRLLRKLVPPFRMIRQPVKIFCILPTVLAPCFALGWEAVSDTLASVRPGAARTARTLVFALLVLAFADLAGSLRIGIAMLPPPNRAYGAVAENARARGTRPHVLVLPLWPGDSAWSSLYEYRVMQGRIRMLNGYSPVRTDDYLETVFRRFESVTQGRLTADQADALRTMGVTAVVLHEDFPDVVSPFPVLATLHRLHANPRLEFLQRDGGIWAFALRDAPREIDVVEDGADALLPPARWWHWAEDPWQDCGATNAIQAALRSPVADGPALRWMVRTEGDGSLRILRSFRESGEDAPKPVREDEVSMEGGLFLARPLHAPVATSTAILAARTTRAGMPPIRWLELPLAALPDDGWATPVLALLRGEGSVRITDVLLAGGTTLLGKDQFCLPAGALFRGGLLECEGENPASVRFRPGHDPAGVVLYGPHLPLSPGTWRVTLEGNFGLGEEESGSLCVLLGREAAAMGPVGPGAPVIEFVADGLEPLVLRFRYAGRRNVRVDAFLLERRVGPGS